MRRVKVQWQGEEVEGEEVDSRVLQGEDWSEYQLSDGTKLKMKTVVTKVVRLNKRNPEGEPIYAVTSQNVLVAQVEPHLMVDP